jgi:hypothetical protein
VKDCAEVLATDIAVNAVQQKTDKVVARTARVQYLRSISKDLYFIEESVKRGVCLRLWLHIPFRKLLCGTLNSDKLGFYALYMFFFATVRRNKCPTTHLPVDDGGKLVGRCVFGAFGEEQIVRPQVAVH